ncbi:MAG: type II toxin-antitoxin system VapC family toxin [Deltaproteobacteria bacterium]|nr:type II toxin-antitoxin system VapC family toxin [Deltaproteobacteria bacterium]
MSAPCLLDACTISNFLRRDARQRFPELVGRIENIIREHGACVSVVTSYELRRGLRCLELRGEGQKRLARTSLFLQEVTAFGLDANGGKGWDVAVEIYAQAQARTPAVTISEGDLLTVATAIAHSRVLCTTDEKLATLLQGIGLGEYVDFLPLE